MGPDNQDLIEALLSLTRILARNARQAPAQVNVPLDTFTNSLGSIAQTIQQHQQPPPAVAPDTSCSHTDPNTTNSILRKRPSTTSTTTEFREAKRSRRSGSTAKPSDSGTYIFYLIFKHLTIF